MDTKGKFRSKLHARGKRVLGAVLALAMLATMLVVSQVGTKAVASPKGSLDSSDAPTITFYGPEAIWLKLENTTDFKMNKFDKFASLMDGANAGLADSGTVYFSCSQPVTSYTIKNDKSAHEFAGTSLAANTAATHTLDNYNASTDNVIATPILQNSAADMMWTVTFVVEGVTFTARAYTAVWAPSLKVAGAAGRYVRSTGVDDWSSQNIYAIMGLHSVSGGGSSGSSPSGGSGNANSTLRSHLMTPLPFGSVPFDKKNVFDAYTAGGSDPDSQTGIKEANGTAGYMGGANNSSSATNTDAGYIVVDKSRFSSLSEVPNLRVMNCQTDDEDVSGWDSGNWAYINWNGTRKWTASSGNNGSVYSDSRNRWGTSTPVREGVYWSSSAPEATFTTANTQTVTARAMMRYYGGLEVDLGIPIQTYVTTNTEFSFTIRKVNKSDLRDLVLARCTGRFPDECIDNANGPGSFNTTLSTAANRLGNPKDTNYETTGFTYSTTTIATQQRTTPRTAKANAYQLVDGATAPMTAAALSPKAGEDWSTTPGDSKQYYFGDYVTVVAPKFPGWSLKMISRPSGIAFPDASGGFTEKIIASATSVTWEFIYEEDKSYTITYNANGGGGTAPVAQGPLNKDTAGAQPLASGSGLTPPTGKKFAGWSPTPTDALPKVTFSASTLFKTLITDYPSIWNTSADPRTVTLYAVWDDMTAFRVEYYPNAADAFPSGSPAYSEGPYTPGVAGPAIKPLSAFTRPGYTLIGWSTTSGDTNTVDGGIATPMYNPTNASYTFGAGATANLKLYAVWQSAKVTVTFKNGSTTVTTKEYNEFELYGTLPTPGAYPALTKSGYHFEGWNTSDNQTTANIAATDVAGTTADIATGKTVYAAWAPFNFTVQYNLNGTGITGTAPPSFSVAYGATSVGLAGSGTFSREGYDFKGWALTQGATVTSGLTFPASQTTTTAADLRSSAGVPTGNNVPTEAITLYAVWEAKKLEVTYAVNWPLEAAPLPAPAIPVSNPIYVKFGSAYGLDANTNATRVPEPLLWTGPGGYSTLEGWVFMGWYQQPTGADSISATMNVLNPERHTIYARWSPPGTQREEVKFLPNGGQLPGYGLNTAASVVVLNADVIAFSPRWIPTRIGYTFDGWAFKVPGDIVRAILDPKVSLTINNGTGDHTIIELEAQWVPTVYSVVYHADNDAAVTLGLNHGAFTSVPAGFTNNGQSTAITATTAVPGGPGTTNVPAPTGTNKPTCYGYNFVGFAAKVNGALVTAPILILDPLSDATLAALIGATGNYDTNDDTDPVGSSVILDLYAVWEPKGGGDGNPGGEPFDPDGPNPFDPPGPPDGPADIDPDNPNSADDGIISLYFVTGETNNGFYTEYVADAAGVTMDPLMRARSCQFAGTYGWGADPGRLPMAYTATQYTAGWKIVAIGSRDAASLFHPDTTSADTLGLDGLGIGDTLEPGTRVLSEKSVWVKPIWANDWVVNYDAQGGTVGGAATATKYAYPGQSYGASGMVDAVRTDYDFQGWFTAPTGGTRVSSGEAVTADITLYAQWAYSRSWWDDATNWFNDKYGTTGRDTPNWVFTRDLPQCLKTGLGISLPFLGALGFRIAKISTWHRSTLVFWGLMGLMFVPLALLFSCVWTVIRPIMPSWWPQWTWHPFGIGIWLWF